MVPAQFSPEAEGLLATIVFLSVAVLHFVVYAAAEAAVIGIAGEGGVAHRKRARVEPSLYMPPPTRVALLPERVELLTVTVPGKVVYAAAVEEVGRYCRRGWSCAPLVRHQCCLCRRRIVGAIAGEDGVAHRSRATIVGYAAAGEAGAIAGEGGVAHRNRAPPR